MVRLVLINLDGYGVFVRPKKKKNQQFYISKYNDFLTYDGLEFATNGSDPDNLVYAYC